MNNGNKKIEKNTEYAIRMPDGKVQKFAYYSEKENGRLILLNTKYGTLTSMGASYFLKLISGKYPCSKRPYNVEYPEDYEKTETSSTNKPNFIQVPKVGCKKEEENNCNKEMLKWAKRLKTLPARESEIVERELHIAPDTLGENLEKWVTQGINFEGSPLQTIEAYEKVKKLLKGTEWDIK